MKNRATAAAVIAMLAVSCSHLEETKFEKVYFESVAQKVAKAQGTVTETPVAVLPDVKTQTVTAAVQKKDDASGKKMHPPNQAAVSVVLVTFNASSELLSPTAAQAQKPKKKKFKVKELEISSDSMTFNKDTSIAVFTGKVLLAAAGVKLKCDKLSSKNYKDNADATGNVRAYYKAQKTNLRCARIEYGDGMSSVKAYDGVITEKYMEDGNTITMYSDESDFDTGYGSIEARKIKKQVKVVYKDIVAFSDKVIYNDENGELEMSGKPVVKKNKSSFTSSRIIVDTVNKTMRMESDIWTRIFYGDLKKMEPEVKLETDNNPASR